MQPATETDEGETDKMLTLQIVAELFYIIVETRIVNIGDFRSVHKLSSSVRK